MTTNKKVWVYDIEQFMNFHSCTFMEKDDKSNVIQFVIARWRNDVDKYYDFLKNEVAGLIGFNNMNYDYPMLHFFMSVMKGYSIDPDADRMNNLLFAESQRIINEEYSAIQEDKVLIPQLDLYRIHHFDNKNKRTSLKAVEIAINFKNVQDIPYDENHEVQEHEEQMILDYNLNDVEATYEFYILSKDMIDLRKKLTAKYNINLRNANDPKIGQEIFIRQIAKKKSWSYSFVKEMRTFRHYIDLGQCILDYIKFESDEFNELLTDLKSTVIETTYDAFDKSVLYKGFRYDYGTGGIHGCIAPGVYEANDKYFILDIDVEGFYPNLSISNNFYPQHLGPEFVDVYKEIVALKEEAGRTGDKITRSGMKLAGNGVYGKSNDKFSPFYDPKYTMQITINGQLLLSMLAEKLVDEIEGLQMLQVNTDGLTIRIPNTKANMDHVMFICEAWEEKTKLKLEYAHYQRMIIRDVNNYLAITVDGKVKPKGCFEIIPMQNGAIAYNKDWSMRVVPKALHAYFLHGTPIDEFIRNHKNIYDFCIGFRAKEEEWQLYQLQSIYGQVVYQKLQKTIRYYVSVTGGSIVKRNIDDGRMIRLNAGFASTLFNTYEDKPFEEYGISYNFYIAEANKIKLAINSGQLKLDLW